MMVHRVAVLAHGHPAVSPGGAEIAAHTLYRALRRLGNVEALHLSCVPQGHPPVELNGNAERECFVEAGILDPLHLSNLDPASLKPLLDILRDFEPDTVHLHHVLGFGADALFALRGELPGASIVMTLHEFVPICHRQGQMVKAADMAPCLRAAPEDCGSCFPDIAPVRFLRREHSLRALFSQVDRFIAPSAFLAGRYAAWGLPPDRIAVLENAVAPAIAAPKRPGLPTMERGRFAFFGQITPYKGLDVLLEAVRLLPEQEWRGCSLQIHGGGLDRQPADFRRNMLALLEKTTERASFHGPYENADLPRLMAEVDWVVVPSIWWENSPVVIQEAFRSGCPVIAGDIGGMAEKVRDGVDGLTFRTGDPSALATCMMAARSADLWERLRGNIVAPVSDLATARAHLRLYTELKGASPAAAEARRYVSGEAAAG